MSILPMFCFDMGVMWLCVPSPEPPGLKKKRTQMTIIIFVRVNQLAGVLQKPCCNFSPCLNSSGPCALEQHPACARWFHSYPQEASRWTLPQTCGSETERARQRCKPCTSRYLQRLKCAINASNHLSRFTPPPKKKNSYLDILFVSVKRSFLIPPPDQFEMHVPKSKWIIKVFMTQGSMCR